MYLSRCKLIIVPAGRAAVIAWRAGRESVTSVPSTLRWLGGSCGASAAADSCVLGAGSQMGGLNTATGAAVLEAIVTAGQGCRLSGWSMTLKTCDPYHCSAAGLGRAPAAWSARHWLKMALHCWVVADDRAVGSTIR